MYNCVTLEDTASRTGFNKLGVEQVGCADHARRTHRRRRGQRRAGAGRSYEITPQDLQAALGAQKLTLQPGDAVLIHTGWGTLWGKDNARYQRSSPDSASRRPNGSASRIRCSSAPTTAASKWRPIPTRTWPAPATRSFSSSTASPARESPARRARRAQGTRVRADRRAAKIQGGTGSSVAPIAIR